MATRRKTAARRRIARPNTKQKSASETVSGFKLVPSRYGGGKMLEIRSKLKLNRDMFARMIPASPRSLATIEGGETPKESVKRRLTEIKRIVDALSEVIEPATIGEWLNTPNEAFHGLKPLEVIERGEVDRIWRMIFQLRSGVPS